MNLVLSQEDEQFRNKWKTIMGNSLTQVQLEKMAIKMVAHVCVCISKFSWHIFLIILHFSLLQQMLQ